MNIKQLQISAIAGSTLFILAMLTVLFSAHAQSGQKWATGGNTTSSSDYLGTSNAMPLVFKTQSIEKMRLTASGNLGLGLTNPVYRLDVDGRFHLAGSAFIDSTLSVSNIIVLYNLNTINTFTQDLTIKSLMGGGNKLLIADNSGKVDVFSFTGSGSDVLYGNGQWGSLPPPPQYDNWWQEDSGSIYSANSGNVGIGTPDPAFKLDVSGDIKSSGSIWAENIYAAHSVNIGGFTFRNGAGGGIKDSISAQNPVSIKAEQSIGLDADTVTMRNRVGIGKDNPEAALDVYGDVIASGSIYTDNLYAATSVNIGGFRFSKDTMSSGKDSISTPSPVSFSAAKSIEFLSDTVYLKNRVGIGITNPQAALDVNGDIRATGSIIGTAGMQMGGLTEFDSLHVVKNVKVGNSIILEGELPGEEENHIYTELSGTLVNDPTLYLQSKSLDYNTVINARNNGLVGIGTEHPLAKLHVVNRTAAGGSASIRLDWNFEGQGIPSTVWDMKVSQGKMEFLTPDYSSPVIAMSVDGKVGMGTQPAMNLHIKGGH